MEGRGAASFKWSALIQMLNGTRGHIRQTLAACKTRTQDDSRWVVQAGVPPRPSWHSESSEVRPGREVDTTCVLRMTVAGWHTRAYHPGQKGTQSQAKNVQTVKWARQSSPTRFRKGNDHSGCWRWRMGRAICRTPDPPSPEHDGHRSLLTLAGGTRRRTPSRRASSSVMFTARPRSDRARQPAA